MIDGMLLLLAALYCMPSYRAYQLNPFFVEAAFDF